MATELSERLYGFEGRENDLRRSSPENRKRYDIKQMWQRHHEIVNLAAQGYKNNEIAYILGITPNTVSMTLNSELGTEKLATIRKERDEDVKLQIERVRVLRDKALKVYQELFDGYDENGNIVDCTMTQRLHAADVVTLELAGMKAPTKIQTSSTILTGTELIALKERALAEAKICGKIQDISAEEVPNES